MDIILRTLTRFLIRLSFVFQDGSFVYRWDSRRAVPTLGEDSVGPPNPGTIEVAIMYGEFEVP